MPVIVWRQDKMIFRALNLGYITQEHIDDCDPNVMIAVPRLAIVRYVPALPTL